VRSNQTPGEKAREYAFLLLKFRLRSESELYSRLKKKKFPESIIRETLQFLNDKQFIGDAAFARAWANSRARKKLGPRRIENELKLKGVDKGLIDSALSEAKANYPEIAMAKEIAEERLSKLKEIEPYKRKQKIYAYLLRRGFLPETITDVLDQLCFLAN